MLSFGIPVDFDDDGNTIVDLNIGREVKAHDFPQDSEFQLLAFRPESATATVVSIGELTDDISDALNALKREGFKGRNVDWYRRLTMYCSGMKESPC
jgi:hypothetical protein